MKNQNLLSEKQLNRIKSEIRKELTKRGFHSPFKIFQVNTNLRTPRIEFLTENFQTTPVLFESIRLANFNSNISGLQTHKDPDAEYQYRDIWISVHIDYKHFTGGGNVKQLFDFWCKTSSNGQYVYDIVIR